VPLLQRTVDSVRDFARWWLVAACAWVFVPWACGSDEATPGTGGGSGSGGGAPTIQCDGIIAFSAMECASCATQSCCAEIAACGEDADCMACFDGVASACGAAAADALNSCITTSCSMPCQGGTSSVSVGPGPGAGGGPARLPPPICDPPIPSPSHGSCVALGGMVKCNPVTNEGCNASASEACDVDQLLGGFSCFGPPNNAAICAACGGDTGWCKPGSTCIGSGKCAKFCCDDGDCAEGTCLTTWMAMPLFFDSVGVCVEGGAGGGGGMGGAGGTGGAGGIGGAAGSGGKGGGGMGGATGSGGSAGSAGSGTAGAAGSGGSSGGGGGAGGSGGI
jgi:hypothetical protein